MNRNNIELVAVTMPLENAYHFWIEDGLMQCTMYVYQEPHVEHCLLYRIEVQDTEIHRISKPDSAFVRLMLDERTIWYAPGKMTGLFIPCY